MKKHNDPTIEKTEREEAEWRKRNPLEYYYSRGVNHLRNYSKTQASNVDK